MLLRYLIYESEQLEADYQLFNILVIGISEIIDRLISYSVNESAQH